MKGDFVFEVEAYWGSENGSLRRGTVEVVARTVSEAMSIARATRLIPTDRDSHDLACAGAEYFQDHYDVEQIGDQYDEIRDLENWIAVMKIS